MRGRAWTLVHALWLACALSVLAAEATAQLAVHLDIRDELTDSGLAVSIRRNAPAGTSALAFMEDVVAMEYRRYPGVGVFVTSLCGVAAPDGAFWALTVNSVRAGIGISDLTIEEPVHIRWDLVAKKQQ